METKITEDQFCRAFAKSMAVMISKEPATILIVEEIAALGAITANIIFKEKER